MKHLITIHTGILTVRRLPTSPNGNSRFAVRIDDTEIGSTYPNSSWAAAVYCRAGQPVRLFMRLTKGGKQFVDNVETVTIDPMALFAHLGGGDGTKWGPSDWYDAHAALLATVLPLRGHFDTGWVGCKKEICSTRVRTASDNPATLIIEVSVSDDFDTEATGTVHCCRPDTVESLNVSIDMAHEKAAAEQKSVAAYVGFSLMHKSVCKDYLILPSDGDDSGSPPGDNYQQWGWQDRTVKIPARVRAGLIAWVYDWMAGKRAGKSITLRGWTIKPWDAE